MRSRPIAACLALFALAAFGCAGPNLFTDLGSVSTGTVNRGRIRNPQRMPITGKGWRVPPRWKRRGFHYATDELIAAVQRAAGRVRSQDRRAVLGVADFSRKTGGRSAWHSSHHAGRDVDLLFYTRDEKGRPMAPLQEGMVKFDRKGKPVANDKNPYEDADWESRLFDARRNWQLVEALLTDGSVRVQWIFVSDDIKAHLLQWARRHKRPPWLVDYARTIMRQPGDSAPHDDHFHVRVYCTRADRFHGCQDSGPVWQHEKKTFKYQGPERYDPVAWRLLLGPARTLL